MHSPSISVCHATARLPRGWEPSFRQWLQNADHGVEYIVAIHQRDLGNVATDDWPPQALLLTNDKRYCSVDNWNCAAAFASGDIIILNADDFFPPPHWDTDLLKAIAKVGGEYVVHVSTGCPDPAWEDRLITLAIMSRRLYERWGYALYPEYESMDSDVDFTERAYREGIVIEARHLTFEHRHPIFGKAEMDATYRWQNRPEAYALGASVLARRRACGFAA